jgi:cytidylate kinase/uncharacterized membrane protein YczE
MKKSEIKQYIKFAISIVILSLGTALVLRANLGAMPELCPPYALGTIPGQKMSPGVLLAVMHTLFVLIQLILLRRNIKARILIQIPISIAYGLLVDLMLKSTHAMQWDNTITGYIMRVVQFALGIAIIGISYSLQIGCKIKLATEELISAFAETLGVKTFNVRVVIDISLALTGLIFCVFYYGKIHTQIIGIGTLLSLIALDFAHRILETSPKWLKGINGTNYYKPDELNNDINKSFPIVITIARMHGSGGHDIGYKVARRLGINFYDKEIITSTAEQLGLSQETVSDIDQNVSLKHFGKDSKVFETQASIIRKAAEESCVIIGRCADYILRGRPYCLNIFIRCDADYAVTLICNKDNLDEREALEVIRIKNNAREKHYAHYTGGKWMDPSHYDLVINTAKIGIDSAVDIICNAVKKIINVE